MYSDAKIGKSLIRRVISESKASNELTWHRDRRDRIVLVVEGVGWKFQRDNEVPKPIARGDILTVSANEWHRIIPGTGNLVVVIKEGEKKPEKLLIDLIGETPDESGALDLDGTEPVDKFQVASIDEDEHSMLVSEDDMLEAVIMLREAEKKKRKIDPDYLTKDARKMRDEIRKHAKKSDDDPSAYTSHSKGGWKADYDEKGRPYKTKPSSSTLAFKKRFGEGEEDGDDLEEIYEADDELLEELGAKVVKALKNKAEKANAPLGALKTIYRKGLAAWRTGHKPGSSQHQWAMARVNSVLVGGKARKVDDAQWKQIQKHRKK